MKAPGLALILLLVCTAAAQAEKLILSFSSNLVSIGSSFAGVELTLFGSLESETDHAKLTGPYDIIAIVRGPLGAVTVREKQPFGPFWLTGTSQMYVHVPSYLSILANRPVEQFIEPAIEQKLAATLQTQFSSYEGENIKPDFTSALIRLRKAKGLFKEEPTAILFLSATSFQAPISLPSMSPLGRYAVEVLAFADGKKVAMAQGGFWVDRGGLENTLAAAAHRYSWLYGLAAVSMALFFGWVASMLFRKD